MLGDAPALVRLHGSAQRNPHARCAFRTSHCVHLQTFLSIQTVDPLGIYLPPLAPQQNGEPPISVPNPTTCQIPQAHAEFRLHISPTLVPVDPARDAHQPAGSPLTELIRLAHLAYQLAPP